MINSLVPTLCVGTHCMTLRVYHPNCYGPLSLQIS